MAKEHGVQILPVDSEHSAIFQALHGEKRAQVEKLLITASGGPFRGRKREELEHVTLADTLKHPNWVMGQKITVDSATLVNKGLEVMEARWLFDVDLDHIQVVVQPKSIIHSMVEFKDGAVMAQLGTPDMRLPIQYALYYPERRYLDGERLDFHKLKEITFEDPDMDTFLGLPMAMDAARKGGSMPTVFNAANELAVKKFLQEKIGFLDIYDIIAQSMERHTVIRNPELEEILAVEDETYKWIILALLIFSAIILFHELGHFLLAKKNKIVVTEFSLGMGPRLLSTEKNGTRYSLKLLPLGGSCAMLGEDMEDESKGTFNGAPVWGRIATVAAGPVFNFILAFVFAVLIVTLVGYDPAEVTQVESGSTVAEAGLQEGDIIKEYQGYHIDLARDLYLYMYLNNPQEDETIHMTVERDGKDVELAFKPDVQVRYLLGFNRKSTDSLEVASLIPGMGLSETGVEPGDVITSINGTRLESSDDYTAYLAEHPLTSEPVTITYERDGLEYNAEVTPSESRTAVLDFSYNLAYTKTHGFEVLKYGTLEVKYMIRSTLLSLKELLTGGLGVKDLSGPVGVVDAIGSTYEASKSEGMLTIWVNMLYMAALLSANLGVMNLLPLPALDGGRLVFLIIEAIRRKPVNRQIEGMVHFAGLMVLMLLMVVVMYNDILKIF